MEARIRGTPEDWFAWLKGADEDLWKEATLILGGLSPKDPVDPSPIIAHLDDSDSKTVFWAIIGVLRLEHRAAAALPKLAQLSARDPAFGNRQIALRALVRVAPRSPLAKGAILYALGDDNFWVRHSALEALIDVPELTESDLDAIRKMEQDREYFVRQQTEITLRNIRLRSPPRP